MAYREAAKPHAPVALFLHGNPTSSYIWHLAQCHSACRSRCTLHHARSRRLWPVRQANDAERLANQRKAFSKTLAIGDIMRRALPQFLSRIFVEGARKAGGSPDDQAVVWKLFSFRHQRIGAND